MLVSSEIEGSSNSYYYEKKKDVKDFRDGEHDARL